LVVLRVGMRLLRLRRLLLLLLWLLLSVLLLLLLLLTLRDPLVWKLLLGSHQNLLLLGLQYL
jgi:hypothetical protein